MNILRYRLQIAGLLTLAAAACCGCGQPKARVYGEITYDGVPVKSGGIVFEAADGMGRTYGTSIVDGRYELNGEQTPKPKLYQVAIITSIPTGRQIEAGSPSPPGTMVDEVKKIRHQTTEEINAELENELSFDLKP